LLSFDFKFKLFIFERNVVLDKNKPVIFNTNDIENIGDDFHVGVFHRVNIIVRIAATDDHVTIVFLAVFYFEETELAPTENLEYFASRLKVAQEGGEPLFLYNMFEWNVTLFFVVVPECFGLPSICQDQPVVLPHRYVVYFALQVGVYFHELLRIVDVFVLYRTRLFLLLVHHTNDGVVR